MPVGVLVFWASIPMAVVLLVAMISVHLPYGFSSVKLAGISASGARFGPVGYEIDQYLAAPWMLAVRGPGPFALENVLQGRRSRSGSSEKRSPPRFQSIRSDKQYTRLVTLSVRTPRRPVSGGRGSCTQRRIYYTAFDRETTVPPKKPLKRF